MRVLHTYVDWPAILIAVALAVWVKGMLGLRVYGWRRELALSVILFTLFYRVPVVDITFAVGSGVTLPQPSSQPSKAGNATKQL